MDFKKLTLSDVDRMSCLDSGDVFVFANRKTKYKVMHRSFGDRDDPERWDKVTITYIDQKTGTQYSKETERDDLYPLVVIERKSWF